VRRDGTPVARGGRQTLRIQVLRGFGRFAIRSVDFIRTSGHERRINRPDTCLHPAAQRHYRSLRCTEGTVHSSTGYRAVPFPPRRPPSAPCARLQPRQLRAESGDAPGGETVVADETLCEKLIKIGARSLAMAPSHAPYGRDGGVMADVQIDPDAHCPIVEGLWGRKARTYDGRAAL
jgi:hypothetical protein